MQNAPLVSVISPCYNGEKYLKPFLESLLTQTYNNVEFFFVNDGSTDKTEEIFLPYKQKLEQKGWKVFYHEQKNGGAAKALNYGLDKISGKYLTWPDSDDILYPNYLERKVQFMEDNPDCSLLFNKVNVCKEDDLKKIIQTWGCVLPDKDETFFDNLIFSKGIIFCPIASFVRVETFLKVIPSRKIYEAKGGQNWQMLLPMSYKQKVCFMDDILGCYVRRESSHSHNKNNELLRILQYEDVLIQSVLSISMPKKEEQYYLKKIRKIYSAKYIKCKIKLLIVKILGEKTFNRCKKIICLNKF